MQVGPTVAITPGNRLPLVVIPLGIPIHNIELVCVGVGCHGKLVHDCLVPYSTSMRAGVCSDFQGDGSAGAYFLR